jgi:hypothetical protein
MEKLVQCEACQGLHVPRLSRCPHCDAERRTTQRRGRVALAVGLGTVLSSCGPLIAAYGICMFPDGGFCDVQETQDAGPLNDGGPPLDGGSDAGPDSGTP